MLTRTYARTHTHTHTHAHNKACLNLNTHCDRVVEINKDLGLPPLPVPIICIKLKPLDEFAEMFSFRYARGTKTSLLLLSLITLCPFI